MDDNVRVPFISIIPFSAEQHSNAILAIISVLYCYNNCSAKFWVSLNHTSIFSWLCSLSVLVAAKWNTLFPPFLPSPRLSSNFSNLRWVITRRNYIHKYVSHDLANIHGSVNSVITDCGMYAFVYLNTFIICMHVVGDMLYNTNKIDYDLPPAIDMHSRSKLIQCSLNFGSRNN